MRLEQLFHIVEVSESKSISLAAEHCYVSQPAISASIAKLEQELGVSLFKRTSQGMIPTEVGENVIQKANEIISQIEEIKDIAKNNAKELSGDVSIAVEPSFCKTIMVNILTSFQYKHPKVNVMMKVGESNDIVHDILSGKVDIGIVLKADGMRTMESILAKKLFKDKLMVIAGNQTFDSKKTDISVLEALEKPVALYNTGYETGCVISQVVNKYGQLKAVYRFDNLNIIEEMVAAGTCISFVPKIMLDYYRSSSTIRALPINDVDLDIEVMMVWAKRHRVSNVEKVFINTIKSLCSMCEFV